MIGMLIYEMFHNTTPFKGDTPTQLFKSILSDKVNHGNPDADQCNSDYLQPDYRLKITILAQIFKTNRSKYSKFIEKTFDKGSRSSTNDL